MKTLAAVVEKAQRYRYPLVLTLIIALAAYLRLHGLANDPPALSQDEVVNGYDAYSIGHTLRDHHGILLPRTLGSFGDSASVALTYLTVPFVVLGGLTDEMVRLPIALTGIASVWLMYALIREVTKNKSLALLGAFMLAVAPWHITLTRWAVPPTIVPFSLLLFLWLFAVAVNRHAFRTWLLIAAGLAAGLLAYSYPSAEILAPFFILTLGLIYFWQSKRDLLVLLVAFAVAVAPLFYLIVFEPSSNFARFGSVKLTSHGWALVQDIATRYKDYFTPNFYFGPYGNNPIMHVPGVGNFYNFWILGFLFAFLIATIVTWRRRATWQNWQTQLKRPAVLKLVAFGLIWLILGPVPASVSIDKQHVTRAIFMFPLMTLILVGLTYFVIVQLRDRAVRYTVAAAFIVASLIGLANYVHIYDTSYVPVARVSFQYGVKQGMQYLVAHQAGYRAIIVDRNINQPYIYYLFYGHINPKTIDYNQINYGELHHQSFAVVQLNNYFFTPLTSKDVQGAKLLTSIKTDDHTWYDIYSRGHDELIMKLH